MRGTQGNNNQNNNDENVRRHKNTQTTVNTMGEEEQVRTIRAGQTINKAGHTQGEGVRSLIRGDTSKQTQHKTEEQMTKQGKLTKKQDGLNTHDITASK